MKHLNSRPLRTALALALLVGVSATSATAATKTAKKTTKKATTTKAVATTAPATTPATTASPATSAAPASSAWDDTVAAAKKEGKVTLYSVMVPGVNDRIAAAWKKAYPDINLEIVRVLSEVDSKLEAERTTGAAGGDVVAHVDYPYATAGLAKGYWVKPIGPNATSSKWKGGKYTVDDTIYTTTLTSLGIAYNTNQVRSITDFPDLLSRDYAGGQIGIPDPTTSAAVSDFYAFLEDRYGPDFLTKLAAQKPVIYSSAVPLEQGLQSGEISIGAYVTASGMLAAQKAGAPVKFVLPPNAWASPIYTYIPKWSKHPNAAQVLFDWMTSPDGQATMGFEQWSPIDGTPGVLAPISHATPINIKRVLTDGWFAAYSDRWKSIFRK